MKKRTVFGLPLNPAHLLNQLDGRSFCVSYWSRQKLGKQLDQAIGLVGQDELLMVDNGAFSAWQAGTTMDASYWDGFARWGSDILARCPQAVVVIPDVIDGDEVQNDDLINDFLCCDLELEGVSLPIERLMPVWHMHESLDRLVGLIESGFVYVAIGSSGQYAQVGTPEWHARVKAAFAAMDDLVANSDGAYRRPWIHMMRAQSQAHAYDFDSSDSTNVAVNHGRYKAEGEGHVGRFADRVAGRIALSCDSTERATIESPASLVAFCAEADAAIAALFNEIQPCRPAAGVSPWKIKWTTTLPAFPSFTGCSTPSPSYQPASSCFWTYSCGGPIDANPRDPRSIPVRPDLVGQRAAPAAGYGGPG